MAPLYSVRDTPPTIAAVAQHLNHSSPQHKPMRFTCVQSRLTDLVPLEQWPKKRFISMSLWRQMGYSRTDSMTIDSLGSGHGRDVPKSRERTAIATFSLGKIRDGDDVGAGI